MEKNHFIQIYLVDSEWGKRRKGIEAPIAWLICIHEFKAENWNQVTVNDENPG